jgi:hypothetical protein
MNNLALIDTKSHEIKVFSGAKKKLAEATFNIALLAEEVERMRSNPLTFLESVGMAPEVPPPECA